MIYLNELENQIRNQLVNRVSIDDFKNSITDLKQYGMYGITTEYFFNLCGSSIDNKSLFSNKINRLIKACGFTKIVSKNFKVWLI